MNPRISLVALGLSAAIGFAGCQKVQELEPEPLKLAVPDHFPEPIFGTGETAPTAAGFELGRRLFYDPGLSVDGTISCGSCHTQVHAFADHNVALSTGVGGALGTRNSPALSNLAWYPTFMADGGITHLDVMPLAPLMSPVEMAADNEHLMRYLKSHPVYPRLFQNAFGGEPTGQRLLKALAQFQAMLVSANARYDQWALGQIDFTDTEQRGYDLFVAHCSTCHTEPLFTDFSYANTGLDSVSADAGRYRITLDPLDHGAFKVPNLRNVALTRPYMHDGRLFTLRSVVDHYADGIIVHPGLDERLPGPLGLDEQQREDLVAFLETLTDYEYLANSQISEPR